MALEDFNYSLHIDIADKLQVPPLALQSAYSSVFFGPQELANSCAINAQQQLIEEFLGVNLPEKVLAAYARASGMFDVSTGTSLDNTSGILKDAGIPSEQFHSGTPDFLKAQFNNGSQILASLDLDGDGILDHQIRILGFENGMVHVVDPSSGPDNFPEDLFFNAWQGDGVTVPPLDIDTRSEVLDRIENMLNSVTPDQYAQMEQEELSNAVRSLFVNPADVSYQNYVAGVPVEDSQLSIEELPEDIRDDIKSINVDVGNILATGGYMALMQFYNDHPDKQKKITRVAMAIGAFDAFTNFGDQGISLDFELNPLLITSLAYYISIVGTNSKNIKIQKLSIGFNKFLATSFRVMEYAGYAAIAVQAIDVLTNADFIPLLAEFVDAIDFLDIFGNVTDVASGGADLVDGLATLGIGIAASRLVRYLFKKLNQKDLDEITNLTKTTSPKKILAKMLEHDAPIELLCGPYSAVVKGSAQC